MPLSPGTRLGHFEIDALVGAGGMGEVYRAKDTRLDRTVAIKVLPEHLSANPELRQRLEQEARAVSSLNHPHICTLHDIGRHEGVDFLVMEYVDGETLADRLAKGPLPLAQALAYAVQIGDALDRAHGHGVVHRDLKPGNIITTKSGAKLLDFGLARLRQGFGGAGHDDSAPTAAKPITQEGAIVGTLQYMSPEQLEGAEADARTDIFAFGALLYEMVTGNKAFSGKTQASLIHAIMGVDPPPIRNVKPLSPRSLERIVETCLAKDPDERWQSARDMTRELRYLSAGGDADSVVTASSRDARFQWGALGLATGALLAIVVGALLWPPAADNRAFRFRVQPENMLVSYSSSFALSPDGRTLAYLSLEDGSMRLRTRTLGELVSTELHAADAIRSPFFSPNGESIGFVSDQDSQLLQRIATTGGPVVTIGSAQSAYSPSWADDDTIVFGTEPVGLFQIRASGGEPELIAEEGADLLLRPQLLPGGNALLFTSAQGVTVHVRDRGERRVLLEGSSAQYAAGHLVYHSEGSLWAVPFDVDRLELRGTPSLIADDVEVVFGSAHFAFAANGTLAYLPADESAAENLVWVDRNGQAELVSETLGRFAGWVRLSPSEDRLALESTEDFGSDIWIYDLVRGAKTRLTRDGLSIDPIWSPDGSSVAFSRGGGQPSIYRVRADGGAPDEAIVTVDGAQLRVTSWSPDGRLVTLDALHIGDVWVAPVDGGEPTPFVATPADEWGARFSPGGDYIAYVSDDSGRDEIYVEPYPGPGTRWTVSTGGGREPVWSKDGRELFYRNRAALMAVDITNEPELRVGAPRTVFEGPFQTSANSTYYDVSNDGTRFVMLEAVARATSERHLVVVMNWLDELSP